MKILLKDNFKGNFTKEELIDKGILKKPKKNIPNIEIKVNDLDNILFEENKDDIVFKLRKVADKFEIESGNYIGVIRYNDFFIEIISRFHKTLIERILNVYNNIFLENIELEKGSLNFSYEDSFRFILYYVFVQKLKKSLILGLPKSYKKQREKGYSLKGKLDIGDFCKNYLLKKDKFSSINKQLILEQLVIDIIFKALKIIKNSKIQLDINYIYSIFKQNRSKKFISNLDIRKAFWLKSLKNPLFFSFKEILHYANLIINYDNFSNNTSNKKENFSYLVNIAKLFEVYIYKLISNEFTDWHVFHEEKNILYKNSFFERKIIPDIVMKKSKKIAIFDVKYKRMNFKNYDLDREDFFQIHTYMSYYKSKGYALKVGGLIYPIEDNINTSLSYTENFLDPNALLVIEGINKIKYINSFEMLITQEKHFLNRLKSILYQS